MDSDSLQLQKPTMSEEAANHLLQQRDTDRDGAIDKKELMGTMNHHHHHHHNHNQHKKQAPVSKMAPKIHLTREQIKEVFMEHDIDGDGFLSVGELTRAFGFLGSILPFYKAHYGLKHADDDGDGLISEHELEKLIDYAEKMNKKK